MYLDYDGEVDDEDITGIVEKVLERFGIEKSKKEISRQILEELDHLFSDSWD